MDLHLNIFFLLKPLDDVKPSETVAIAEDGAGTTPFGIVNHFFFLFSLELLCYLLDFLHNWYIYVFIGLLVYSFAICLLLHHRVALRKCGM